MHASPEAKVIPLRPQKKRLISVSGGKGGVGKSIISVNLAAQYSRLGLRTVLVDGDVGMADLNLMLGAAPDKSLWDVTQGVPVEDCLTAAHGLHLLAAVNGSFGLANAPAEAQKLMVDAVKELTTQFDVVIVDIPAGIEQNAMELAALAQEHLVVVTPEPTSLADAYANIKVLSTQFGVRRVYLVPNGIRHDSQGPELVRQILGLTRRFLQVEVEALPPIPYDATLPWAAGQGVPAVLVQPDAPGPRGIARLARALSGADTFKEPRMEWGRR